MNTAAYTAVDKAENEETLATTINGVSVGVLAEESRKLNALLVHYSTDYVFDGKKREPYTEADVPNPVNAYGRSKLAGEKAISQTGCNHLILRTSWVYAARGNNFFMTMLRLSQERDELRIVDDQHGAPTWARNIADVTAHVLAYAHRERMDSTFTSGIYHLCAGGKTTWYGFSCAIIEKARQLVRGDIRIQKVLPITTEEYRLPAPRPENSAMESTSLGIRFGLTMPEWRDAMDLCLAEARDAR